MRDKILVLILVVVLLGLVLRGVYYATPGVESTDAPITVAGGVYWFVEQEFFPGMVHWQPPVGHYLLGLGCIVSGEDFSGAADLGQQFKPNIPFLIGESVVAATPYCVAPLYIFGVLFLIGGALLSFSLLKGYSRLYAIALFAFFPLTLWYSRYYHVDIIYWVFVVFGLFFTWKGYSQEKRAFPFFMGATLLFALATATKFIAGAFFLMLLFLYYEKRTSQERGHESGFKAVQGIGALLVVFLVLFLVPFQLDPSNVTDVYTAHNTVYGSQTAVGVTGDFLIGIQEFLLYLNPFDFFVFFFGLYALGSLLIKRQKERDEKFILYLSILSLAIIILFGGVSSTLYLVLPFYISFFLLMALTFSDKPFSLFNRVPRTKPYALWFFLIYIAFSFATNALVAPTYLVNTNPLLNTVQPSYTIYGENTRHIANTLQPLLQEGETFYYEDFRQDILYFYLDQEFAMAQFAFEEQVRAELGRLPNIEERIQFFTFNGKRIRYILVNKARPSDSYVASLIATCEPVEIVPIRADGLDEVFIFDLDNLNCN